MENKDMMFSAGAVENDAASRDELEKLRQQVSELRNELGRSKIVNDRVLRQAMRGRSSWLGNFVKAEAVAIPIFGLIFWGFLWLMDASFWPAVGFVIISAISTFFDTRTMTIQTKAVLTLPMSELKTFLKKQKRHRMIQLFIEIPIAVAWLLWFFFAIKSTLVPGTIGEEFLLGGLKVGLIVGLILGVLATVIIYSKAQHTNDALIDTIDANMNEEQ